MFFLKNNIKETLNDLKCVDKKFFLSKFIDIICGDGKDIAGKYYRLRGTRADKEDVYRIIHENKKKYLLLIVFFLVLASLCILEFNKSTEGIVKNKYGEIVSVIRPKEGENSNVISGKITAQKGKISSQSRISIVVEAIEGKKESGEEIFEESRTEKELMENRVEEAVRGINLERDTSRVKLPVVLDDGTTLKWMEEKQNNLPLCIAAFVGGFLFIYSRRYFKITKEERAAEASIRKHLPEFMNKVVLLLEGGMVFPKIFEKILEEEDRYRKDTYFYHQLKLIYLRVKEGNCFLQGELEDFAKRSGSIEFIRMTAIIGEISERGTAMAEKLSMECEALWFRRKKDAEEKGRLMDTKLTMPLTVNLFVLVLVTVSPAFLEM